MLRRPEGATAAQVSKATGWATHTVRGFFAGLKKKGIEVAVKERVRTRLPSLPIIRGATCELLRRSTRSTALELLSRPLATGRARYAVSRDG